MGSTVVLAILGDGHASVANIGDSRAYLIHEGNMSQVSLDHSVVAEQVRQKDHLPPGGAQPSLAQPA